jgi:hypothetical protein
MNSINQDDTVNITKNKNNIIEEEIYGINENQNEEIPSKLTFQNNI